MNEPREVNQVRRRILLAVAGTCAVLLACTFAGLHAQLRATDRGAQVEALNLARAVAYGAALSSQDLQHYVAGLDGLYQRDIVVVNPQRRGLADADPREIGQTYNHDLGGEVGLTLRDAQPRTFVERGPAHPEGLNQIVVPLLRPEAPGEPPIGAVIMEYSGIQTQLRAAARWELWTTGLAGVLCAMLVGGFGWRLARSITEAAHEIEHVAYHDRLTGLPNRSMFTLVLGRYLRESSRYQRRLAVFFIDLDRFKNINDTLGHEAGDLLLQEVAERLKACLRASDTVARLGGDEFVVVLPNGNEPEQLAGVAHKILAAVARPILLQDKELRITASIGISAYPEDGLDERALMKNADIAMYQAKEDGKNGFAFYSEALNRHSVERLAFEASLRHALELQQFEVQYQPKVDCHSGRMTGFEALLRWHHPDLGTVPPLTFIPVAEETGLIVPLGRWVLETACRQQVAWCAQGHAPLPMAVNLSARQFSDEHLLADVQRIVAQTGIDPHCLELEITESMLMHDVAKAREVLSSFRDMGIRVSVDDFGTGYSSLSNLKQFPIDTIKVDRSFIRDIMDNKEDKAIADAIIAMGKTLSLTVVAEGVETQAQADFLRDRGCHAFQGFHFSRAVSPSGIEHLLSRQDAPRQAATPAG
jgi:diguanylate cyclase (GGDEF)-like protein